MQKSMLESDILNEYRRGSHSIYKLTYHVIFVTKYRKKVITAVQRSEKYIEDQRTEEHKRKYIKTGKYKKKS